jgi:hypothetical protein
MVAVAVGCGLVSEIEPALPVFLDISGKSLAFGPVTCRLIAVFTRNPIGYVSQRRCSKGVKNRRVTGLEQGHILAISAQWWNQIPDHSIKSSQR